MNLQLFEILESRINSSATPIAPFNPAAHISRVAGPFVQAAVQASVDSTPATPPTPSLDVETLLHNRQAAIDPLPTLSVIYDAQSVVHYDLPVWNGVPTSAQIHQGDLGDCYLIADLQAMADQNPAKLMQAIKIYSDGTYGVTFHHIWTTTEIRVDGNFGSQQAVPTGALWGVIIEKAYAAYRFGQNTYASIVTGTADDFSWAMGWSVGGVTIAGCSLPVSLRRFRAGRLRTPIEVADGWNSIASALRRRCR